MLVAALMGSIAVAGIFSGALASAAVADEPEVPPWDPSTLPPLESEPLDPIVTEFPVGEFYPSDGWSAPSPAPMTTPGPFDINRIDGSQFRLDTGAATSNAQGAPAGAPIAAALGPVAPVLWTALTRGDDPSRFEVPSTTEVLFVAANSSPHAARVTLTWEHGSATARTTMIVAAGSSADGSIELPTLQRAGAGVLTMVAEPVGAAKHETDVQVEAVASVVAPVAVDDLPTSSTSIAV